jgi:hypothetical protein
MPPDLRPPIREHLLDLTEIGIGRNVESHDQASCGMNVNQIMIRSPEAVHADPQLSRQA